MSNLSSLKVPPPRTPRYYGRSDALETTRVPSGTNPRDYYLKNFVTMLGPIISHSEFVPRNIVQHLMRDKKDSALGVKWENTGHDTVTNMEGALHTYVVPLVPVFMHGDHVYRSGHDAVHFPAVDGFAQARRVILSALIQPDFESSEALMQVAGLRNDLSIGKPLGHGFEILSASEKQDNAKRAAYDERLRQHIIYHLVESHSLPSRKDVEATALSDEQAQILLEQLASGQLPAGASNAQAALHDKFVVQDGGILSLELLFASALHQFRNELGALEYLATGQGYVYTFDPPVIFANKLNGKDKLLNRCMAAVLRALIDGGVRFTNMRAFAIGDFADKTIVGVLKHAFAGQPHVTVLSKYDLYPKPAQTYVPPETGQGAILVLHNNSDAFGQNIETEGKSGSMDGLIGNVSSAAASLHRQHPLLLEHVF